MYVEKSLLKYIISVNNFNFFATVITFVSFLIPAFTIRYKVIFLLFILIAVIIYGTYSYIKDLKEIINSLELKNNELSELLSATKAEVDAITQNRNYLEKLLKYRDNSISFYEKLLKDIDMFHLIFLATPSECERNNILQLKDYISNQVRNFKENDFNE